LIAGLDICGTSCIRPAQVVLVPARVVFKGSTPTPPVTYRGALTNAFARVVPLATTIKFLHCVTVPSWTDTLGRVAATTAAAAAAAVAVMAVIFVIAVAVM